MTTEVYNFWSLILQMIVAGAVFATVVVYYLQLRAMQKSAVASNILALINFLQQPRVHDARTVVRSQLKSKSYEQWTVEDKRAASVVCSTYDIAGLLILDLDVVPEAPFISSWGPSIRDCYEVLKPFHSEMRSEKNSGSEYWKVFERLAAKANEK